MDKIIESFDEFKSGITLNEKDVSKTQAGFQVTIKGAEKIQPKEAQIIANATTKFFSDLEKTISLKRDDGNIEFTWATVAIGHVNESVNESVMTIGDFADAFIEFYEFLESNKKHMDSDTIKHIKQAIPHLNKAWQQEADAHGTELTPYIIKF